MHLCSLLVSWCHESKRPCEAALQYTCTGNEISLWLCANFGVCKAESKEEGDIMNIEGIEVIINTRDEKTVYVNWRMSRQHVLWSLKAPVSLSMDCILDAT